MAVDGGDSDEDVAERVALLRRTVHPEMNCRQFAKFLGVSYQRLNNVETGLPLSKDLAGIIRRKVPGVSTDWLHYGDLRTVTVELGQRLSAEAEKAKTGR